MRASAKAPRGKDNRSAAAERASAQAPKTIRAVPRAPARSAPLHAIRELAIGRRHSDCGAGLDRRRAEPSGARMKILFLVRDLAVGGSQRQLALLAAGLARRGHDVAVAALYAGGPLEELLGGSGARLLSVGKSSRWHVLAPLARLRRLFLSERPDLVYAFLPAQTTLAALLLPPRTARRNSCSGCAPPACSSTVMTR